MVSRRGIHSTEEVDKIVKTCTSGQLDKSSKVNLCFFSFSLVVLSSSVVSHLTMPSFTSRKTSNKSHFFLERFKSRSLR